MTSFLARVPLPVASARARVGARGMRGPSSLRRFGSGASLPSARLEAAVALRAEPEEVEGADDIADDFFEEGDEEQFEEVPGTYEDAINPRSKLGKVIKDVCGDLESLGKAEMDQLEKAQSILEQMGYKGSLFDVPEGAKPALSPLLEGEEADSTAEDEGSS